ncbi:non-homologous end-joining DNA ligase [Fictibacillus phosphorivorans]|uniref:non-homologous end-joining DNA ligase n=1 Tax=Fictibacillus phosphorivorans TaxID=1221500 RepID=UPI00203AF483|nr:non-homologous end-joining DNA ligase [Fictibacillus phosphorivorans]MCM3719078.1 non-homologous end-joining DNA ligase [Fictibacillus phosphorivorans]MCM3776700.1 non-homologous end-joining DNA ligase [Fictibacillus phosphorivorans]
MGKPAKESLNLQVNGEIVTLTSPDKPLWPELQIVKVEYINYLTHLAPFMLPFLRNRALTVIRYPHGVGDERFYQKNCPDYAPSFIQTVQKENINYIMCNNLPTLLWLGNQLAFEFHIPYRTSDTSYPSEIVMDLDPPSRDEFKLSVEAALMIKEVCDSLRLTTFIKTSGNKGMQIYIPLPADQVTFEESRLFTEFLAHYLIEKEPRWFTIERLKKNRGNKCYIDYIQHAEGKTIIAPYSVRGNEDALVAAPLYWHEVKQDLRPELFPLTVIHDRIKEIGDPFQDFFSTKNKQPISPVIQALKEKSL